MRYRYWKHFGGFWRISAVLAVSACIAENSAIAFYKYYSYSPEWGVFIGHVPLHVVLIWPLFILGEYHYLRDGLRIGKQATLAGALRASFCLVDVTLLAHIVEVYCVSAGLWSWRRTNCLGVPWIGALGWAFFATPAVVLLSGLEEQARFKSQMLVRLLLLPLVSVAVLHIALLTTWHGLCFRRLEDVEVSGSVVAGVIVGIQCLYHLAVTALKLKPVLLLSEELPRLLACGIVASLWLFKGSLSFDSCLVSAASLVRLLAFQIR